MIRCAAANYKQEPRISRLWDLTSVSLKAGDDIISMGKIAPDHLDISPFSPMRVVGGVPQSSSQNATELLNSLFIAHSFDPRQRGMPLLDFASCELPRLCTKIPTAEIRRGHRAGAHHPDAPECDHRKSPRPSLSLCRSARRRQDLLGTHPGEGAELPGQQEWPHG